MATATGGAGGARGVGGAVPRRNTARVLRLVHQEGPVTRAEVTRRTGLNRSTTLALVGELVALGLVHESDGGAPGAAAATAAGGRVAVGATASSASAGAGVGVGVGRPSPVVRASSDVVAVAVTVEIDAVTVALVGLDGTIRHRVTSPTTSRPTAPQAVAAVATMLDDLADAMRPFRTVGIGVAIPGTVRVEDGLVRYAPHLGWRDEPFAEPLAAATGRPVRVANDANLGAFAEHLYGSGRGVRDLIYLNGGASGIGGGVISAGRPLSGADGYAGELGHTFVADNGIRCHCGAFGCLETEASRADLVAVTGVAADDLPALGRALAAGGPEVQAVVDRQVAALATGLRNAIHTVNPEVVALGGFLGTLLGHVGDRIVDAVRAQSMAAMADRVRIVPTALGADVLLRGAAEIGFRDLLDDPTRSVLHQEATTP
ncbi:ROK family transcriptional regulator [Curtobacterium sp. VKM Ac-2922]|uniref:ROK family transcriptional regulator n=1 Tax=Curtobacterium sp. VKM Ac-2922 TaxID=2929475 RepID=UPI001FB5313D|nr:ROK family transcriptional regulator [Curtobacterium sp. VKM Ac-2922]MCJ1712845.1 ROK family protein [Curtobacterium sp. VKM Ac-2922]